MAKAKTKVKSETELALASLFDLQQELTAVNRRKKELEAARDEIQGELLMQAEADGVKEVAAGPFVGEVAGRETISITPDALLEYLDNHNKMHLAPVLMSVLGGRVTQYLGKDVREALGDKETIEYHKMKVTRNIV